MDASDVIRQTWAAFEDVPPPRGRVAPHHCHECDGIARAMQGRPRESLSREELVALSDSFVLLGPEAFAYYFPRLVEAALEPAGQQLLDGLVSLLRKVNEPHGRGMVELFGERQRDAVRILLRFLKDNERYLTWHEPRTLVNRAIPLWDRLDPSPSL